MTLCQMVLGERDPGVRLAKLGAGAERYYLATVAAGLEDHRPAGLEPDGVWQGSGSVGLGLSGKVGAGQLEAVLAGSDPASGQRLNPAQSRIKVVGWDLVFAAPKSVSILFGIAEPDVSERVRSAHGTAVGDALGYLERVAVSARRRDHARRWSVPTAGVIAAGFVHRTSRLADPHLHTHVLVSNLVEGEDGRWTALDARGLYAHGMTASYLYHSRLRNELVRAVGVAFGPVIHGVANVAGVGPAVMANFSRRRGQVLEQLEKWDARNPRAAQAAALATRTPKDLTRSVEDLRVDWLRRAGALGLVESEVRALTGRAAVGDQALDFEAITSALVERTGSFGKRDLLRAVAQALVAGSDVASIERISEAIVAGGNLVVAHSPEIDRWRGGVPSGVVEARWTTRARVRAEQSFLSEVRSRGGSDRAWAARITHSGASERASGGASESASGVASERASGVALERALGVALERRPELSSAQVEAVRHLVGSERGIEVLWTQPGPAGSDVLEAAREVWELLGLTVLGLVGSCKDGAALEPSTGVAATRSVPAEAASPSTVVLVAGAQRRGVVELSELLRSAGGARVVLVADAGTRGPSSELLRQLASSSALMHHVEHRPAEPSVAPVRVACGPQHSVVVGLTAPALRRALVDDWWAASHTKTGAVMVARTHVEVDVLNSEARARMREAAELGGAVLYLGKVELAVGDWVHLRWGHARLGLPSRAKVIGIEGCDGPRSEDVANKVLRLRSEVGAEARVALDRLQPGQLVHGYALTPEEVPKVDRELSCLVLGGPDVLVRNGREASLRDVAARSASPPVLAHYVLDATLANRSARAMTLAEDRARLHPGRPDELCALVPPPTRRATARELPASIGPPPPPLSAAPVSHGVIDAAGRPQPDRTRSLAELVPELDRLRSELLAGLPPDPTRQLAELAEERAAVRLGRANAAALMPGYVQRWDTAAERVAERQVELERAADRRQAWVNENTPALTRYIELTRAVGERQLALGRVAEVMGSSYVLAALGPTPSGVTDRDAWREAAGAIEAFRERWQITDANRALGLDHDGELARCRERSEVERTVVATQRRLHVDRSLERERGMTRDRDMGRSLGC
jgi:conjugative relaxase-like TrwC/TraI family protein